MVFRQRVALPILVRVESVGQGYLFRSVIYRVVCVEERSRYLGIVVLRVIILTGKIEGPLMAIMSIH